MSSSQHRQGDFVQADFFDNSRGLNLTDSPIRVLDEQATQGYNYEYGLTGGFRKRRGHPRLNSSANAQTQNSGFGVLATYANVKSVIRAAGTKLQLLDTNAGTTTDLTQDNTAATSTPLPGGTKLPALFAQFNSASQQVLWMTGANATSLYGAYSTSKFTRNGVDVPTGTITGTVGGTTGTWSGTGSYGYAIAYHKASTGAISNAALDITVTVTGVTQTVTLSFTGLTSLDTTLVDKIYIYRSAVGGSAQFTSGDLVAIVSSTTTSYVDTGTSAAPSQNVPRPGNTVLDNGTLPTGTPAGLTVWKRRLVTAINSTVYYSDKNKPESWPLTNVIQIPSGGPITGFAIISFNTPTAVASDELLVIFKEKELWIISGNDYNDVALKFVDGVGCVNQALAVSANGYLTWVNYRGVFLWDGSGKPIYASRPIEYQFGLDGTLDKSKLNIGWGAFHKKTNQVYWQLSDSVLGENQYAIKMDLRLTLPGIENSLMGRIMDGVFIQDTTAFPLYGGASVLPAQDELLYAGDSSGYVYNMLTGTADAGSGIAFSYRTKSLDLGLPFQTKRIQKVIVWVEDSTDANLTLNYWLTYNTNSANKSSQAQPVSRQVSQAIWDLAYWDAASWDSTNRTYSPLVFNLSSPKGTEGDAITLEFVQSDANAPVSIAGFSIIYSLAGLRK